jgi:transcriptional regulator with XRE-family HTH domain
LKNILFWDYLSIYSILGFVMPHLYSSQEETLREILRQARKSKGLRQADLAEKLGVPQSFVSKYESGERVLSFVETLLIFDELDVKPSVVVKQVKASSHEAKS